MLHRTSIAPVLILIAQFHVSAVQAQQLAPLEDIRMSRLRGELTEALRLADDWIRAEISDPDSAVAVFLEVAKIHDRIGLHTNTRPVEAALDAIQSASERVSAGSSRSPALVDLAFAEYHYRAGLPDRDFDVSAGFATRADSAFAELGDDHGRAEAVHRLGLIHLQRRELDEAERLFEESRVLDESGGARVFFRGEYERHVGFVHLLRGDTERAIPYFERSLAARREVGAVDPALFAASSLASALVDVGRDDQAETHILFALAVAESIDSPVGKSRAGLVLGRLFEARGDSVAADAAYRMTLKTAESPSSTNPWPVGRGMLSPDNPCPAGIDDNLHVRLDADERLGVVHDSSRIAVTPVPVAIGASMIDHYRMRTDVSCIDGAAADRSRLMTGCPVRVPDSAVSDRR